MARSSGAARVAAVFVVAVAVIAAGSLLLGLGATDARAHTTPGPATPANEGPHPWRFNGCSTPTVVRVNAIPGVFNFRHACIHHDGCYKGFPQSKSTKARPTYWFSREQCDASFLADMRASCEWQFGSDPNLAPALAACYGYATLYHQVVRNAGAFAYKGPASLR